MPAAASSRCPLIHRQALTPSSHTSGQSKRVRFANTVEVVQRGRFASLGADGTSVEALGGTGRSLRLVGLSVVVKGDGGGGGCVDSGC